MTQGWVFILLHVNSVSNATEPCPSLTKEVDQPEDFIVQTKPAIYCPSVGRNQDDFYKI